jgi:hypothetical protein
VFDVSLSDDPNQQDHGDRHDERWNDHATQCAVRWTRGSASARRHHLPSQSLTPSK